MRLPISKSPPAATRYKMFVDIVAQENILGFATSKEKVQHNLGVFNLIHLQPKIEIPSKKHPQEHHQLFVANDYLVLYKRDEVNDKGYMIIASYKVDISEFFLESFIEDEFSKEVFVHWDRTRLEMVQSFYPEAYSVELCLSTSENRLMLQRMYR